MSTWILLRGLTHEVRHWGEFPDRLREAVPGAQVLLVEIPGNGELNDLASPLSIRTMAAHCRATAAGQGASAPYYLVAMSMGGMVAAAWAEAHPGEVAGCVLINTSFGRFSPPTQRLRLGAWPSFLGIILERSVRARERRILHLTSGLPAARAGALEAWTEIAESRPVSPRNALRQILASATFRAPRKAPVPTLVLSGAADGLVDPRCSAAIARRWRCPLVVHPEAGHDLTLDDGVWAAREISRWLALGHEVHAGGVRGAVAGLAQDRGTDDPP